MRPDRTHRPKRGVKRALVGALASLTVLGSLLAGGVHADPADDALAKLNELSRQAESTTEAMHAAQLDLDNKLAAQHAAEAKHASDLAAADTAKLRWQRSRPRSTGLLPPSTWVAGRTAWTPC